MCLTGEPISAAQALNWGLVNAVADDLDAGVQVLLDQLLDKSPAAIRRGLYTMKAIEAMSFEQSARFTESQIALFALTEDGGGGPTRVPREAGAELDRTLMRHER
jgi:enoyl-CoA hydratase/carnithine racemase